MAMTDISLELRGLAASPRDAPIPPRRHAARLPALAPLPARPAQTLAPERPPLAGLLGAYATAFKVFW